MTARKESAGQPDTARPTNGGAGSLVIRVTLGGEIQLQGDEPDLLLTVAQCAARIGVKPVTWRGYVRDGYVPPADHPGDLEVSANRRSPKWRASTVDAYQANRPGRGRGPRPNRKARGEQG